MNKLLSNKYLLLSFRIIVGFVFLYAGAQKINTPSLFAESVNAYKLFPEMVINISAVYIPWVEIISGLMLIFGVAIRENAFIISTLLIIFIILIVITILRGIEIDCGCFGDSANDQIGIKKIIENIFLLFMATILTLKKTDGFRFVQD